MQRYPFGRPATPRPPSAREPRDLFLLGAYPSAVHVEWVPPSPFQRITAIAVDDEPTPFWDGSDQAAVVERWKADISFESRWGSVRGNAKFNGPCGQKLVANILGPLGFTAGQAWITDCLDTYRLSVGGGRRIADTYNPFAASVGLPSAQLPPHPDERMIVREALTHHRDRLLGELAEAKPTVVVTLGNAALRVLRELVADSDGPSKLALNGYGEARTLRLGGRSVRWLPLAHPAAPQSYQHAHRRWMETARDPA